MGGLLPVNGGFQPGVAPGLSPRPVLLWEEVGVEVVGKQDGRLIGPGGRAGPEGQQGAQGQQQHRRDSQFSSGSHRTRLPFP